VNCRLRDLVGLDGTLDDQAKLQTLLRADASSGVLTALQARPNTTSAIEIVGSDREPIALVGALAPLPPDSDPALALMVGYEVSRSDFARSYDTPATFSPRERDICELLLSRHRVSTIASTLFLSPHTVRNHLRSMFAKTETSSQAELVARIRDGVASAVSSG
jgi:DNA-binding CsgD family transcriptional regulator